MKNTGLKNKKGMAIVIVLCLATVIFILGTIYMKSYTDSTPVSRLQLDRIQADFFAKGIQNIALFKIKKYQDFFLRSYRQYIYGKRCITDNSLKKLSAAQVQQKPFEKFLGTHTGSYQGLFQGYMNKSLIEPIEIGDYSVDIALLNSKDFNSESIEITVRVLMVGENKATNVYKAVVAGNYKEISE